MYLLENNFLDYVELSALDDDWKGYIVNWDQQLSDLVIIVSAADDKLGLIKFRLRLEEETYKDRYVLVHSALVDLGIWYPDRDPDWISKSTPMETTVTFFLKKKRWGIWVWVLAIFLFLIK